MVTEDPCDFWKNELINKKILLFEVEKAILFLAGNKTQKYRLDTGQTNQQVERLNLAELNTLQSELMYQIRMLEIKTGTGTPAVVQVIPDF